MAAPLGLLWGALRPPRSGVAGTAILGAIILTPSMYFTMIMIRAPVSVADMPLNVVASTIGGAVLGLGFYGLGLTFRPGAGATGPRGPEAQPRGGPWRGSALTAAVALRGIESAAQTARVVQRASPRRRCRILVHCAE
jgi:hypothetical protein